MVRRYKDIIEDYRSWAHVKYQDDFYEKYNFYNGSDRDLNFKKARIISEILDLCYKPLEGVYWFFKFILGDMTYAGYPTPIYFNRLWWNWTKIANSGDHISILSSRQVGKSTFLTAILPIYRTTMFKNYNVLIESASEEQAVGILGRIVNIINSNEFLMDKKTKSGKWSSMEITYNDCMIKAKGVGSEVRGGTFDLIICDDILRSDNKFSPEYIESFLDEELEPMIFVRGGQLLKRQNV
jgi:hypothetical protein